MDGEENELYGMEEGNVMWRWVSNDNCLIFIGIWCTDGIERTYLCILCIRKDDCDELGFYSYKCKLTI